jgi:hypothetical protein
MTGTSTACISAWKPMKTVGITPRRAYKMSPCTTVATITSRMGMKMLDWKSRLREEYARATTISKAKPLAPSGSMLTMSSVMPVTKSQNSDSRRL